jgi:hypothetical protein
MHLCHGESFLLTVIEWRWYVGNGCRPASGAHSRLRVYQKESR